MGMIVRMKPTTLPLDPCHDVRLTPEQMTQFHNQGYVIVKGLMRPEAIAAFRDETLAIVRARNLDNAYLGQSYEYLAGGVIDRWIHGGNLKALADSILEGPASLYLPFTAVKGPHQGRFTFHQDNQYTNCRGPARHIGLNVWTALVPMTVANGCLQIVPQSHLAGTRASTASPDCPGHKMVTEEPSAWIDCLMEAGDAVIFDRLNVHGSGENRTTDPRVAYAVQWHRHDTEAFIDGTWDLLTRRPAHPKALRPVAAITSEKQRGE